MLSNEKERGYTLFLAVLIITIFGILGMTLLSITISGSKKSTSNEETTQAHELAEKGIDHLNQQIHQEIQLELGTDGLPRNEFANKLMEILHSYHCQKDNGPLHPLDSETGNYAVCVEQIDDVTDESGKINDLRKLVTLKSIGEVNGKTEELLYKLEVGASTVPDALKYALSTIKLEGKSNAGDGNIYLHGGVEVYGDIKADKHLFTFDHGPGLSGDHALWRETTLPALYPTDEKETAKIVLGGGLYQFKQTVVDGLYEEKQDKNVQRNSSKSFYDSHLKWEKIKRYDEKKLDKMFVNKNSQVIVNSDWLGNKVPIGEHIENGKKSIKGTIVKSDTIVNHLSINGDVSFQPPTNNLRFTEMNKFAGGKVDTNKAVEVSFRKGEHLFNNMYVKGNVTIGNLTSDENPDKYDDITIGGYENDQGAQLFVDGDVTIQGADLKSNLTIYATGTVTVKYTTINGKVFDKNKKGSLIVFTKGKVHISNNSLYKDAPSELKGYFYSEQDLVIFGVGSNIKIHGGIAARRITLNAIRGTYEDEKRAWKYAINPTSLKSPSRLTVEYDTELIENYLKLNPPEPIVYYVDSPELISRQ